MAILLKMLGLRTIKTKWHNLQIRLGQKHYLLGAFFYVGTIMGLAFILVFVFTTTILQPYQVNGLSMYPTLEGGDRLFVWRLGKIWSDFIETESVPKRGEIIIFHSSLQDNKWIKRVVGLPGERVVIRNRELIIYNDQYPQGFKPHFNLESFKFPQGEPNLDRTVGQGEIFVLGDNREPNQSLDSRGALGNIKLKDIDGTVILRVIPISQFRFF